MPAAEAVVEFAMASDLDAMAVLLADRDNTPALDFYRRLGFRPSNMTPLRSQLT